MDIMDMDVLRERLASNRVAIAKDLEPKKYWNYLYQGGIFDLDDIDDLKAEKGRKNMTEALLGKVERSGANGIAIFVQTLSQIQPHLFELLQRELPREQLGTQVQGGNKPKQKFNKALMIVISDRQMPLLLTKC